LEAGFEITDYNQSSHTFSKKSRTQVGKRVRIMQKSDDNVAFSSFTRIICKVNDSLHTQLGSEEIVHIDASIDRIRDRLKTAHLLLRRITPKDVERRRKKNK
jgi:hypothetical protein